MFINRQSNGNSTFTGTIIKYDDSMSSITLNGSIPEIKDEKPKDVLIFSKNALKETDPPEEHKISNWIEYCIVEENNDRSKYLSLRDQNKKEITNTNGVTKKIIYLRANDGFIEYNKFGNVILKGFGTFNCFNKILYLQNGFLIKAFVNTNINKGEPLLIIKHLENIKQIILKNNEKMYISDKVYLLKEDSSHFENDVDYARNNEDYFIFTPSGDLINSTDSLQGKTHQTITIFEDIGNDNDVSNDIRIITFNFSTGTFLYYIDNSKKGYLKITSPNNFKFIEPPVTNNKLK